MKFYDLFSTRVYKTKINPSLYDKQTIVNAMIDNYKKQPQRNSWDKISKLHHLYNDWENKEFDSVNTESLLPVYDSVLNDVMQLIKFKTAFKYKWNLVNLAINSEFMKEHDHFYKTTDSQSIFSCIHYIKFNKEVHSQTTFINPLPITYFSSNVDKISSMLENKDFPNSTYFCTWDMNLEEDDFIVFPSYLKHVVYDQHIKTTEARIVSVINVELNFD